MSSYQLDHLSNQALFRSLNAVVSRNRVDVAELLAHLAEFDARRLYASAGYPSMFTYCVDALHFSEPEAGKRIHAARTARRFPILFPALASGSLHLTAVGLLAPHLTDDNANELAEAASHRSKYAIETLLARRFPEALPRVKAAVLIRAVAPPSATTVEAASSPLFEQSDTCEPGPPSPPIVIYTSESSAPLDSPRPRSVSMRHKEHPPEDVATLTRSGDEAPGSADNQKAAELVVPAAPPHSADAPECFLIRVTVSRRTYDKLREAQALLSHTVRPQDVSEVLDRALDALITLLKRRKIGSLTAPTTRIGDPDPPAGKGGRYIPAEIRRIVWSRDGGQCTFVSADGHRCGARRFLQFDHVDPVARGGSVTVETIRLRCSAHNQLEAERVLGAQFMEQKRREARDARKAKRSSSGAEET